MQRNLHEEKGGDGDERSRQSDKMTRQYPLKLQEFRFEMELET